MEEIKEPDTKSVPSGIWRTDSNVYVPPDLWKPDGACREDISAPSGENSQDQYLTDWLEETLNRQTISDANFRAMHHPLIKHLALNKESHSKAIVPVETMISSATITPALQTKSLPDAVESRSQPRSASHDMSIHSPHQHHAATVASICCTAAHCTPMTEQCPPMTAEQCPRMTAEQCPRMTAEQCPPMTAEQCPKTEQCTQTSARFPQTSVSRVATNRQPVCRLRITARPTANCQETFVSESLRQSINTLHVTKSSDKWRHITSDMTGPTYDVSRMVVTPAAPLLIAPAAPKRIPISCSTRGRILKVVCQSKQHHCYSTAPPGGSMAASKPTSAWSLIRPKHCSSTLTTHANSSSSNPPVLNSLLFQTPAHKVIKLVRKPTDLQHRRDALKKSFQLQRVAPGKRMLRSRSR